MSDADREPASGVDPETGEWTPAFPGQRRPFQKGHTKSMLSGFTSERVVGPLAAEIAARLFSDPYTPYLAHPMLSDLVTKYARAEARQRLLLRHMDDLLAAFDDDDPPGGMPLHRRHEAARTAWYNAAIRAATLRGKLGLSPMAQVTGPPDALWRKAAAEYGTFEWERPPLPPP